MLVEGTDVPPGMSYRQAARKAVASCVSDFAAKGVRPDSFMVSLGLRRKTSSRQVKELALGLREAADEWGLKLVGGDTNEAKELVIDCVMVGNARKIVARGGARAGDLLVASGAFGLQPAGLKILMQGAKADERFRTRAIDSVFNPRPNLEAGIALAPYLTSSMDSSDGLARSVHTLAKASGVGFELTALPIAVGVRKFAKANRLSTEELALVGGEEYVIVGTMPEKRIAAATKAVREAKGSLLVMGKATNTKGKVVLGSKGSTVPIPDEGWTHLG
jgi:thiamine-monophosphate kinase